MDSCLRADIGQSIEQWDASWENLSPDAEIRMWDFYGLRNWILKYVPRNGKTIEAGCGMGRYVFYLSKLGIDIEGIDFSARLINLINSWKIKNDFDVNFISGDISMLPYKANSLNGYISLGVLEHFKEGPHVPLQEAYRVLKDGGIAIISTPSVSFNVFINRFRKKLKRIAKKILRYKIEPEAFFQYWYRPKKLKRFIESAGFKVVRYSSADLMYAFCERGNFTGKNLKEGSFAYWFANKFENTPLNTIGAQSITISVKTADKMHCFFCDEKTAGQNSLLEYDVAVCKKCSKDNVSLFYLRTRKTKYDLPYIIEPPVKKPTQELCEYCRQNYFSDILFEDYGFSKKVCRDCLQKSQVNIDLANNYVKPIWRPRA